MMSGKLFRREPPLLETLVEFGGRASVPDILERVYHRMKEILRPDDFRRLQESREERWRNTAKWERKRIIEEKLLRHDSGHGYWEVIELGRRELRERRTVKQA